MRQRDMSPGVSGWESITRQDSSDESELPGGHDSDDDDKDDGDNMVMITMTTMATMVTMVVMVF